MKTDKLNRTINLIFLILFFIFFSAIVYGTALSIHYRFKNTDARLITNYVHDGVLQTEEAIKFTLKGKNPYTENYFNTPVESWGGLAELNGINPALYHFAYLPFTIIFSIPFFIAGNILLGWFDERLVYLFSLFLTSALIFIWPNKPFLVKTLLLIAIFSNPLFSPYFINGRNDIFVLLWIILSVYFLNLGKINYSSIALAMAATSKQSSWFMLPFYFAYLFYREPANLRFAQKVKNVARQTQLFFITAAIILSPFLISDYKSFIDDTISYSNGTAYMSYPMRSESGWGFMQIVLREKLASSPVDYWPFWIPQLIVCLPLLYLLLKIQKSNNSLSQMIFNFALLLFAFWSFSRFFSNNYLGFLIALLFFAFFLNKIPPLFPEKTKNI